MNKIFSLIALAGFSLTFAGCSDDPGYNTEGSEKTGEVKLADMSVEVNPDEITLSRAADINLDPFLVKITDADGNEVYSATYADRKEIVTLPVGENYTVKVESHEVENAAWAAPYYTGSKTFSVVENEITEIGAITAKFANIRVSVKYSDELKALMADDVTVTVRCSETGSALEYGVAEARSGYFKALDGSTTLGAVFAGTVNGSKVTLTKALNNVEAGQHRIITFGVKQGNPDVPDEFGNIGLDGEGSGTKIGDGLYLDATVTNVDVDGNVDVDEEGDGNAQRPGQEDGDDPNPPTPPTPGDDPITITSDDVDFNKDNPATLSSYLVKIHADEGIAHLWVEIKSTNDNFLLSVGEVLATKFDLAEPGELEEKLTDPEINLPVKDQVVGKKDLDFNVSTLVPLLAAFPGDHQFVITVIDAKGNELTKIMKIKA